MGKKNNIGITYVALYRDLHRAKKATQHEHFLTNSDLCRCAAKKKRINATEKIKILKERLKETG